MLDEPKGEPGSSRTLSHARVVASHEPSAETSPASVDQNDKTRLLSLRKARKLSRVFANFSLLDSFTMRKSVDDLRVSRSKPNSALPRPTTCHGHIHKSSLGDYSSHSLDGKPRPTSPTSPLPPSVTPINLFTMPISNSKASPERAPQSPIILDTSSTPQIKPSIPPPPENDPLPRIHPGSSRSPLRGRKRRQSLDLNQLNDACTQASLSARSRSLRIPNLSQPNTPKSPSAWLEPSPVIRDPPTQPEAARQHFLEVRRARKMTQAGFPSSNNCDHSNLADIKQLFGQELQPELIRVLDDRRSAGQTRHRTDSTASSTVDSVPSTPTVEGCTGVGEDENVMPTSPPTKPCVDFQERRRRVAKLSQFFGVNHAEIAPSVAFTKPDHHHATSIEEESRKQISISYGEPVEVGVKVVSRRRWGLGEDMRDVELSDAISRLRCLKAN